MMSEPTTVDRTTVDELTGKLVLLIEEKRPWHETDLMHRQLAAKVKNYVRYVRSPEFDVKHHGQSPKSTIVRLVTDQPPGAASLKFFERVAYELGKHGLTFEHQTGEDGMPVALTPSADATFPPRPPQASPPPPAQQPPPPPVAEPPSPAGQPALGSLELEPTQPFQPDGIEVTQPFQAGGMEVTQPMPRPARAEPPPPPESTEELPGFLEPETIRDGTGAKTGGLEFIELDGTAAPPTAPRAARADDTEETYPPFFPEEEFGRAVPEEVDETGIDVGMSGSVIIESGTGKKFVLDADPLESEFVAPGPPAEIRPSIFRAVGGALGAAIAGAVVWALLSIPAGGGSLLSLLSLPLAFMVGFSVRIRGAGRTVPFRIIAIIGTIIGSALGAALSAAALTSIQQAQGIGNIIDVLRDNTALLDALNTQYGLISLGMVAVACYLAFRISAPGPGH